MASRPEIMERLVMQPASSVYPLLGTAYKSAGNNIEYSMHLVMTGKSYYDSKPKDGRMSTAAEELAIQLSLERAGQDPKKVGVFNDLFVINDSYWRVWQWTATGLRIPKGRDPTKYETDAKGRKYWAREVLIGKDVIGEILVPEGNGRVAVEWDEVFGLPKTTDNIDFPHKPYTTHFWFNQTPSKDGKSGHYDVAVGRRGFWLRDVDRGCLAVNALYARSDAGSDDGFRPVRGSLPEIKNTSAK
ncbi:MAG: hypothetical protein V1836_01890 [Candidatus Aenigmatarchaeota archaeon]